MVNISLSQWIVRSCISPIYFVAKTCFVFVAAGNNHMKINLFLIGQKQQESWKTGPKIFFYRTQFHQLDTAWASLPIQHLTYILSKPRIPIQSYPEIWNSRRSLIRFWLFQEKTKSPKLHLQSGRYLPKAKNSHVFLCFF